MKDVKIQKYQDASDRETAVERRNLGSTEAERERVCQTKAVRPPQFHSAQLRQNKNIISRYVLID